MICKTLRKFKQKMSEECDEETDDKSEEIVEYVDDMVDHKVYPNHSYRGHNGVLPQDYSQSNSS